MIYLPILECKNYVVYGEYDVLVDDINTEEEEGGEEKVGRKWARKEVMMKRKKVERRKVVRKKVVIMIGLVGGDDKDGGDDESLGEDIFLILLCVYAPFLFEFKIVNDFFDLFIWTSDPKSCFLKVQSFVFMDPSNMTF